MKKFIFLIIGVLILALPVLAADWKEIFEKKYIDFETITVNDYDKTIRFWEKALRKDVNDKYDGKPYWYTMSKFAISCSSKQSRIEAFAIYDLKGKILYSDNYKPEWNEIFPDTYADGYYRLFCIVDFLQNPLLNPNLKKR